MVSALQFLNNALVERWEVGLAIAMQLYQKFWTKTKQGPTPNIQCMEKFNIPIHVGSFLW